MQESFFDVSFWQNFVSDASATIIALILGIPLALWLDRVVRRGVNKERRNQMLRSLRETLQKNRELVDQMSREVRPDVVIFYNVDTSLLDSTSSIKYEVVDDLALNRQLDSIKYELQHLHRKVELQLEIEYSAFKAMGSYGEARRKLIEAIRGHFPRIDSEIKAALEQIDRHLDVP